MISTAIRRYVPGLEQRGFSLVELMIAIVLGLMIISVVLTVFISGNKNYSADDRFARMQENGRFGLKTLVQDLGMTGFWGPVNSTSNITSTLAATCPAAVAGKGITFDTTRPILVFKQVTAAAANAAYNCIATTEFQAGTDVLAIERVQGVSETTPTVNKVYLSTADGASGQLIKSDGSAPTAPTTLWEYIPRIYYIRNYTTTAGDGIPALCRKVLNPGATPTMTADTGGCIAEGIEYFHVEFGIDTDTIAPDGIANIYTSAPTATQLKTAVTARVYVLVRSRDKESGYSNAKTYNIGDVTLGPYNDSYHRRVLSSTTSLRNLSNYALLDVPGGS